MPRDLFNGSRVLGTHSGFGAVGEHRDGCLAALGFWAWIGELGSVHSFGRACLFHGLVVKVRYGQCAVVFWDEVDDSLGEAVLACQVAAFVYMADDDLSARIRVEATMRIIAFGMVLGEEIGTAGFADVVIIRAHTCQLSISADGFGGPFCHIADNKGMVISAGSLQQELAQ